MENENGPRPSVLLPIILLAKLNVRTFLPLKFKIWHFFSVQLIFTEECTEAEGRLWHLRHFCCVRCGIQLGGHKYLMIGQEDGNPGKPFCLGCCPPRRTECSPSEFCRTCGAGIPVDRAHIAQVKRGKYKKEKHKSSNNKINLWGKGKYIVSGE